MANRTPPPYLERAEARLRFRIQEENSQRNIQEIIETDDAEVEEYDAVFPVRLPGAPGDCCCAAAHLCVWAAPEDPSNAILCTSPFHFKIHRF